MNPEKRYGLIIPKKDGLAKKKPTIASVFGDDSSDSDKDSSSIDWRKKALQAEANKGIKRQTKIEMERALAEDPTVYQYDEIYDKIDQKKTEKVAAKKKEEKKPRYIQSLLKQAERRKQENERRNERQVQKEREKEGTEFGDKETFVTSSYRKKLEEFKKLDEEERRMDMLEDIGDVSKQQDLGGFYRHLYQTTIAEEDKKDKVYKKPELNTNEEKSSACDKKARVKTPEKVLEKVNKVSDKEMAKVPKDKTEKENKEVGKNQKERSYRKRNKSESSEEEEEENVKKRRANEMQKKADDNPDADTSSSSSSSRSASSSSSSGNDDESEEGEIKDKKQNKKKREKRKAKLDAKEKEIKDNGKQNKEGDEEMLVEEELNLEDKVKSSLDKILEEKKKHLEMLIKEEEEKEKEMEGEVKVEEKKKINIWEKRTVGEVFDGALQRYLERKANREAMRG